MNSDQLIIFLEQLIKSSKRKIFLILDDLSVHHSKVVKEWLSTRVVDIEVFFLPAYSPDLNPDEYLNCDLKQGMSNTPSPRTQGALIENVTNHMKMLESNSARVKKYFKHESISYAAWLTIDGGRVNKLDSISLEEIVKSSEGGVPISKIAVLIDASFGSYEEFKTQFGSGLALKKGEKL